MMTMVAVGQLTAMMRVVGNAKKVVKEKNATVGKLHVIESYKMKKQTKNVGIVMKIVKEKTVVGKLIVMMMVVGNVKRVVKEKNATVGKLHVKKRNAGIVMKIVIMMKKAAV